jgi:dihydroorotase
MNELTIIRPDDWHLHLRDGDHMRAVLRDTVRRFGRAIVMPNLRPPVTTTVAAIAYKERIVAAILRAVTPYWTPCPRTVCLCSCMARSRIRR